MTLTSIPASERSQYDIIAEADVSECYDWQTLALARHKESGQLWLVSDGGCSCNYFWDHSVSAQPVASWQDWAAEAQKMVELGDEHEKQSVLNQIERLMQERPAPSPKREA